MSAGNFARATERTYQSKEDNPRRKDECRENSRNESQWRLLRRAEDVFDRRLWVVMDFFWMWDNGLRSRDDEIEEVNREGFVHE